MEQQSTATQQQPNRCVFIEIFRSTLVDPSSLLAGNQQQQNNNSNHEDMIPITPFLVHQLLRSEGFAQKILLFQNPKPRTAEGEQHQQQQQQFEQQLPAALSNIRRGVVQFATDDEYQRVMTKFGSRSGVVVFLQNVPNTFLRVRTKPARDPQVFISENTENAMSVVNAQAVQMLGAAFPRSSISQQTQQQQLHHQAPLLETPRVQQQQQQQQPEPEIEALEPQQRLVRKRYQAPSAATNNSASAAAAAPIVRQREGE